VRIGDHRGEPLGACATQACTDAVAAALERILDGLRADGAQVGSPLR
jgi:hypothetical protein